jgi:hypothetical protein
MMRRARRNNAPRWEYLVVQRISQGFIINDQPTSSGQSLPELLDDLGHDGWELVSTSAWTRADGGFGLETLYFKRPSD